MKGASRRPEVAHRIHHRIHTLASGESRAGGAGCHDVIRKCTRSRVSRVLDGSSGHLTGRPSGCAAQPREGAMARGGSSAENPAWETAGESTNMRHKLTMPATVMVTVLTKVSPVPVPVRTMVLSCLALCTLLYYSLFFRVLASWPRRAAPRPCCLVCGSRRLLT